MGRRVPIKARALATISTLSLEPALFMERIVGSIARRLRRCSRPLARRTRQVRLTVASLVLPARVREIEEVVARLLPGHRHLRSRYLTEAGEQLVEW